MKWLPNWLAGKYSLLHLIKGNNTFNFDEAKKLFDSYNKQMISAILSKLRESGVLFSWRDPLDKRKRMFQLMPPDAIVRARGIQEYAKDNSVIAKLQVALSYLDYVVAGSYAACKYHDYYVPAKIDLHVRKEDSNTWLVLLTEPDVAIAIDDIPSEKPKKNNIHIHSNLTDEMLKVSRKIENIRYLNPEILVVKGISGSNLFDLQDAYAILLIMNNKLSWEKLISLSESQGVLRQLGTSLDLLNYEIGQLFFSASIINRIKTKIDLSFQLEFPDAEAVAPFNNEVKEAYTEIGKNWNVRIYLSKSFLFKIVTDLLGDTSVRR